MRNIQVVSFVKLTAAIIVGLGALSSVCNASEFTADRVIKSGRMTVTSKCYVKDRSSRTETTMGSEKRILINRPDKNVLWMLNPIKKEYVQRKCQPAYSNYIDRLVRQGGKKKFIKTESVNGQKCDKYLISFSSKEADKTVWFSKKLSHPIKIQTQSETIIYYNIKEGKLPNSLFEVPKSYRKL